MIGQSQRPTVSTSQAPLVSVVITAYNAERFIGACIRAALSQTYPNFEVIVVNDGSTDNTPQICRSVTDPRFRYLTWGRIGRQKALNAGIDAAKGEYIAINDADDLSLPYRLEYSMNFAGKHPELAFLGTAYLNTDIFRDRLPEEMVTTAVVPLQNQIWWLSPTTVYRRNVFVNSTLFYPRSTWQRIGGYDEQLTNNEDYDFQMRALRCGPAVLLSSPTVLWYTNPDSFFKQKSRREYLQTLRIIRRRAHRLLGLPWWLRWYQPLWEIWLVIARRFPALHQLARDVENKVLKPGSSVKFVLSEPKQTARREETEIAGRSGEQDG